MHGGLTILLVLVVTAAIFQDLRSSAAWAFYLAGGMGLADAPILSNLAQGTLLVVQAGTTRVAVVKNALKRLQAARAHVVGGLLTRFQSQLAGGYGYGGYDYYSYGTGTPQLTRK